MKLTDCFSRFLSDAVNLNQTRYTKAKQGIATMKSFIENDPTYGKILKDCYPQGSFRQKTFIKPIEDTKFDVDLLVSVDLVRNWEPKDYLAKLAEAFKSSDRYKDKVDTRGKTRCVTIDYESDFHIDLVPSVENSAGTWIANRKTNKFEATDGDGYAVWFGDCNGQTDGGLRRVVRLMKFLRDAQCTFDAKSILLTTLLGMQVAEEDDEDSYCDTPTSLLTIVGKLNTWLQSRAVMPEVYNPALSSETFTRHWDQKKFERFKAAIKTLARNIETAYDCDEIDKSVELWRKVFGDNFPAPGSATASKAAISKSIASPSSRQNEPIPAPNEMFLDEMGIRFNGQEYVLRINTGTVKDKGFRIGTLRMLKRPLLPKNRALIFSVVRSSVPEPYDVYWKVRNYGEDAANHNDLRGEITKDNGSQSRSENTKYRGTHYVECYAVRNGVCVAFDRIEVPICGIFG